MAIRGGILGFQVDGRTYDVTADGITYNLGTPKREPVEGAVKPLGFSETSQAAYIELTILDAGGLSVKELANVTDATITLPLRNGKTIVFRHCASTGDMNIDALTGKIPSRFGALSAEET